MNDPAAKRLPQHIAIIMDGNGRWAKRRHLPRGAGHKAGLTAARHAIEHCGRLGIPTLTLFAFSSENWQRPDTEVGGLMELFLGALKSEVGKLHENQVRLKFVGALDGFSAALREAMEQVSSLTAGNTGLQLNIAVGYGGRWDITRAARRLTEDVVAGKCSLQELDEHMLADRLCLAGGADPDLFIRTGGEHRISNFLIWNLAYTELYFCDVLWPDFDVAALEAALTWYAQRERRFGRTPEQLRGLSHA